MRKAANQEPFTRHSAKEFEPLFEGRYEVECEWEKGLHAGQSDMQVVAINAHFGAVLLIRCGSVW